jgi:hypothetical protein
VADWHPDDQAEAADALKRTGLAPEDDHDLVHFFSFISNGAGARAAGRELRELGYGVTLAEEVSGDECWHVAAYVAQPLTKPAIRKARAVMEEVAERNSGRYDGWGLSNSGFYLDAGDPA